MQESALPKKTRDKLAKAAGVSHDTIAKVKVIEQIAPLEIKEKLAKGGKQKTYLIGKKYKEEKKEHGGDRKSSGQFDHLKTSEKIAQEHKIDPRTVRRAADFADAVDTLAENVYFK